MARSDRAERGIREVVRPRVTRLPETKADILRLRLAQWRDPPVWVRWWYGVRIWLASED